MPSEDLVESHELEFVQEFKDRLKRNKALLPEDASTFLMNADLDIFSDMVEWIREHHELDLVRARTLLIEYVMA